MPGIQSTPSIILDGSTSAVVPSPILISASEIKFQIFSYYGCIAFDEHSFSPFLGTLTSAILQFSVIHKNWNRSRSLRNKYIAIACSLWGILRENISLCIFPPCAVRFRFSAILSDISTQCISTYSLLWRIRPWAKGWTVFCRLPCRLFFFLRFLFLYPKKGEPRPPGPLPQIRLWSIPSFLHWNWFLCQNSHKACCL